MSGGLDGAKKLGETFGSLYCGDPAPLDARQESRALPREARAADLAGVHSS